MRYKTFIAAFCILLTLSCDPVNDVRIEGKIIDATTRLPVPGVRIEYVLYPEENFYSDMKRYELNNILQTNDSGEYIIGWKMLGNVYQSARVTFEKAGYKTRTITTNRSDWKIEHVGFSSSASIVLPTVELDPN